MNFRSDNILRLLELVKQNAKSDRFNLVEVGCMFKEDEGLSTYIIAKFIKDNNLKGRFVSIELDPQHVDAAKSLLKKYDESLLELVEFRSGDSLGILPDLLKGMGEVHFALLDGGAQPEVCLKEFELTAQSMSASGACLIDDLVKLKPTEYYSGDRPFGKGTLIYPVLIIADYLKRIALNRTQGAAKFGSAIIGALDEKSFTSLLKGSAFCVLKEPRGSHGMLAYGNQSIIEQLRQESLHVSKKSALDAAGLQKEKYDRLLKEKDELIQAFGASLSWKITAPLRWVSKNLRRGPN